MLPAARTHCPNSQTSTFFHSPQSDPAVSASDFPSPEPSTYTYFLWKREYKTHFYIFKGRTRHRRGGGKARYAAPIPFIANSVNKCISRSKQLLLFLRYEGGQRNLMVRVSWLLSLFNWLSIGSSLSSLSTSSCHTTHSPIPVPDQSDFHNNQETRDSTSSNGIASTHTSHPDMPLNHHILRDLSRRRNECIISM